jgi:hypothetical protein
MAMRIILAQLVLGSAIGDPTLSCSGFACEEDAMKVELLQTRTELKRESMAAEHKSKVEPARLQAEGELGEEHVDAAGLASFRAYLDEHFTFDNQSAKDSFTEKHASFWLKSRRNETKESISLASTEKTSCPLVYSDTYFSPRLNLCQDSFTGIGSCTLGGCEILSTFWYGPLGFSGSSCYKLFYSNAGTGYGMCRCWQLHTTVNLYKSSSGNNIYSCSENWP